MTDQNTGPATTPAYMIDGPGTVDRDDAIRIETTGDGARALVVYVADLTSALDADPGLLGAALERGASRYRRAGAVATMLPRQVEAACTLAEGEARPVLAVRLPLAPDGTPGTAVITRGTLADAVALTHEQAASAVKDRRHPHHEPLTALRQVAEVLFRARFGASSAFYDFDRGVFTDEDGALVKVRAAHVVGHLIVQECMIAANRAVAEWALEHDVPIMYRNHAPASAAPPAAVQLHDLAVALDSDDPAGLANWLQRTELTSRRARYDAHPRGHHGLGVPVYCHATSPLRRAADLATQRAIVASLEGRTGPFTTEQIAGACERLTVVIAEAKAADTQTSRTRAHEIARAILDHGADYPRMTAARFHMLVKRATKEGIASPGFLAEVGRRADADLLELRDLYHLLLLPAGGEWSAAKAACLAQVARHSEHAVSLVAMHTTTRGVPAPDYRCESSGPSHGPVFGAVASVTAPDGTLVRGEARLASTKQAAREQAALSVLAVLAGAPDPSRDLAAPVKPAPVAAQAPPASGDPLQALNHARQTGLVLGAQWAIEQAVVDGRPVFRARLSGRSPGGGTIKGSGAGGTKQAAKAAAAAELLELVAGV